MKEKVLELILDDRPKVFILDGATQQDMEEFREKLESMQGKAQALIVNTPTYQCYLTWKLIWSLIKFKISEMKGIDFGMLGGLLVALGVFPLLFFGFEAGIDLNPFKWIAFVGMAIVFYGLYLDGKKENPAPKGRARGR